MPLSIRSGWKWCSSMCSNPFLFFLPALYVSGLLKWSSERALRLLLLECHFGSTKYMCILDFFSWEIYWSVYELCFGDIWYLTQSHKWNYARIAISIAESTDSWWVIRSLENWPSKRSRGRRNIRIKRRKRRDKTERMRREENKRVNWLKMMMRRDTVMGGIKTKLLQLRCDLSIIRFLSRIWFLKEVVIGAWLTVEQ